MSLQFHKEPHYVPFGEEEHGKYIHLIAPSSRPNLTMVGVDPGRNFGICIMNPSTVHLIHGHFPKLETADISEPQLYGIYAKTLMMQALEDFCPAGISGAVVEGAAYRSRIGEANLAYVRMGFYLGIYDWLQIESPLRVIETMFLDMKAPSSIRKRAFGKGTDDGALHYPTINKNAVAALGCALAAEDVARELLQ